MIKSSNPDKESKNWINHHSSKESPPNQTTHPQKADHPARHETKIVITSLTLKKHAVEFSRFGRVPRIRPFDHPLGATRETLV
ncbi:hypothetical protein ACSDQ9_00005, partial [Aestuariimicrobium soli]|uniref:hypothetical protein n=1 Tax=Aestuariimicrobium soli TaxID=2035834 RepID=UPI003EBD9409